MRPGPIAGAGLALSQSWITVGNLLPLLFTLPCAVMMFMCMKGMRHGQQDGEAASSNRVRPVATDSA